MKLHIVDQGLVLETLFFEDWKKNEIIFSLNKYQVEKIIICNVRYPEDQLLLWVEDLNIPFLILSHETLLPIHLKYTSPETLGRDRIAVAVAAACQHPGEASLVVDIGTCITFDLVNPDKAYLGGAISPGFRMRMKAMNQFTGKLPLADYQKDIPAIGTDTISSLQAGAFWGIIHEINGTIDQLKDRYSQVNIFLTGGDASKFEKFIKNGIFADSSLLLKGLNYILDYNEKKLS